VGQIRNVAVVAGGVWAGEMLAGFVVPMLPKGADGGVNPMLEKAARYGLTGLVVLFALRSLGTRTAGKKG
jgi:hypothetical protein